MKRSRTLVLFSLIGTFAIAAATSLAKFSAHVVETAYVTCRAFKNLLVDNFMALAAPERGTPVAVPHIQAKAFQARIDKRERPVLTNSWRMCPSI